VKAIGQAEASLRDLRSAALKSNLPVHPPLPTPPRPIVHLAFEQIAKQHTPDSVSTNLVSLQDNPVLAPGVVGQSILFSGDNTATIPHAGKFGRTDPFSFGLWIQPTEKQNRAVVFHASIAWSDSGSRGYEFVLDEGRPFFALIHFWPGNAVAVRARDPLPLDQWSHVTITYDGSSRADGIHLYHNGEPLPVEVVRDHLYKEIKHRSEWGDSDGGGAPLRLAGRFRDNGFKNGRVDEFQVFDTELTALEAVALARSTEAGRDLPLPPSLARKGPEWHALHQLTRNDTAYQAVAATLHAARVAENQLVNPVREIMVMKDLPQQRPTFVLRRGAYDAPTDSVSPGVPERIMPFDDQLPRNRLGLARWMTDPKHPLTARVAVNRVWKLHFGRGLVATTWDFGAQGLNPSHPELLDWLAGTFVESGWNRKALHKQIVLSATYRQSSQAPADLIARDPENRLLARGPKHRLDAEQIRDSALAASGLLVPTVGGPSVKPHQPAGVWEDAGTGKSYTPDKGDNLYRRSLYTFWRRTAPPPNMLTFDATTREVCTAKRETTSTPLQALVLLNDPQFLEASRVLAEQLVASHPDTPQQRAHTAFRRLTGRTPDAREADVLDRLFQEQRSFFHAPKAKRVIYLFMSGGPSQQDLFDYKPKLNELNGQELPDHVRRGQRLTGMSGNQATLPLAGSQFQFAQHGKSGAWVSDLLPHTANVVDDLCFVKSLWTEAINHDPAMTFFQTGSQIAGRPSLGSWVTYGLGSENENLPGFVVLVTKKPPTNRSPPGCGAPASSIPATRACASPPARTRSSISPTPTASANPDAVHAGQTFRPQPDRFRKRTRSRDRNPHRPIRNGLPHANQRAGSHRHRRRAAIRSRPLRPGCGEARHLRRQLPARPPPRRKAACVSSSSTTPAGTARQPAQSHPHQCQETDQGCAALITDLKQRGMLEDTLVVWGGEFGRTSYSQGKLTATNYGRDHHPAASPHGWPAAA
jgi:hypothetical protein